MPFVTAWANKILDKMLKSTDFTSPAATYVSLHTGDPGDNGANECTGGSYIRKVCTFASGATKTTDQDADVIFTGMPAATITYAGLWDSETEGVFIWGGALSAQKVLGAGDTFTFNAGDIDVTLT